MKRLKKLFSIFLILMMLIVTARQDGGYDTLSEKDPPPENTEIIIEE